MPNRSKDDLAGVSEVFQEITETNKLLRDILEELRHMRAHAEGKTWPDDYIVPD